MLESNKLNALANGLIELWIAKCRFIIQQQMKLQELNRENEISNLIYELYDKARTGYDFAYLWWLYASLMSVHNNRAVILTNTFKLKGEKWKLVMRVKKNGAFSGQTGWNPNQIEVELPIFPLTLKRAQNNALDKNFIQKNVLNVRTLIAHELRHAFQTPTDFKYRDADLNNWGLPLPKNLKFSLYVFQNREMEARLEEAKKVWIESRKKASRNANLLTTFVNIIYDDLGKKRRSFAKVDFCVGLSPIESLFMIWCLLVWVPEHAPRLCESRQWKRFEQVYGHLKKSVTVKMEVLNRIADVAVNTDIPNLDKEYFAMQVEDEFNVEEWWKSSDFEREFTKLSVMNRFEAIMLSALDSKYTKQRDE